MDTTCSAYVGVTCYSSKNLADWRYGGVALSVVNEEGPDIERGCILARPKVIYNPKTKKFVMWFHLELKGEGYWQARYGVAVADNPKGPFRFLRSGRANPGLYPVEFSDDDIKSLDTLNADNYKEWWTPTWCKAIRQGLFMKRDLTAHIVDGHVLPYGDGYIFMADIWRPKYPSDGRYVWLPIDFDDNGVPFIQWRDSWEIK